MRELFVYYRVSDRDEAALRTAVRAFQAVLAQRHRGLAAGLLVRPGSTEGLQTWMETYAIDPAIDADGVSPELQASIEAEATVLAPMLRGPRHTEVFTRCA